MGGACPCCALLRPAAVALAQVLHCCSLRSPRTGALPHCCSPHFRPMCMQMQKASAGKRALYQAAFRAKLAALKAGSPWHKASVLPWNLQVYCLATDWTAAGWAGCIPIHHATSPQPCIVPLPVCRLSLRWWTPWCSSPSARRCWAVASDSSRQVRLPLPRHKSGF